MQSAPDLRARSALPEEADTLTALLRRAKASWGYPQKWMQAWQDELAVSREYIARHRVVVLEAHGQLLGFYGLELQPAVAHLEHLWIEPAQMRRGLGHRLLMLACDDAVGRGYAYMELVADPNAERFYCRHGAIRVASEHSQVLGHMRVLPKMRIHLARIT